MIFTNGHLPVFCGHDPEAGERSVIEYVACLKRRLQISLSFQGKHCVGACFYAASDSLREVNAQEGEAWVGDGIDQSFDVMVLCRHDVVVFPAEWHNREIEFGLCQAADAITLESRTVDNETGFERASRCFYDSRCVISLEPSDFVREMDLPASCSDDLRVFFRDLGIIDYAGAWDVDALNSSSVRFNFANLFAAQHAKPLQSIA